jgi:hypothetical protein
MCDHSYKILCYISSVGNKLYQRQNLQTPKTITLSTIPVIPTKTKMPYDADSLLNNPQTKSLDAAHKQQDINK